MEPGNQSKEGVALTAYRQATRVAGLAVPVVRFVRRSAIGFGVAGLLVWLLWFIPSRLAALPIAGSVITLVFLAAPALVYALFARALQELVEVPKLLRTRAAEGGEHVAELSAAIRVGAQSQSRGDDVARVEERPPARGITALVRLARSLYQLGRLGIETKGALLGAAALVRLGNPVTLLVILVAGFAGAFIALVAFIGLVVAIL